jgi:hypothetical protein
MIKELLKWGAITFWTLVALASAGVMVWAAVHAVILWQEVFATRLGDLTLGKLFTAIGLSIITIFAGLIAEGIWATRIAVNDIAN